jgi:ribosomal subunit interface protein
MHVPLRIEFRHLESSPALERLIRERATDLERFASDVISCRVVVDQPQNRRSSAKRYHALIDIEVRGREIAISRDPGVDEGHVDPFVAVGEAFDTAERRLREHSQRQKGEIKRHAIPSRGIVVELHHGRGFGRLESVEEGREIYFHRNSVIDAELAELEIGFEVMFREEAGEDGPQARFVKVIGRNRVVR